MIKSNPYVYPYTPFQDLSNKMIRDNFAGEKRISGDKLKEILSRIETPEIEYESGNMADRIFEIFINDNFRFGPEEVLEENKEAWTNKINYFIERGEPLQFSILGFPFKVPVSLKTDRTMPDMGEVLSLFRLNVIAQMIRAIYKEGAVITIFTEGVFGKFNKMAEDECEDYRDYLKEMVKLLGFENNLKIVDLQELESLVPDFNGEYETRLENLKLLYDKKDSEFMKKYEGTYPAIYRIINTKKFAPEILMDVYNDELEDKDLNDEALKTREYIKKNAHETVFKYHAYLQVKNDFDLVEKSVPSVITLSVSPKPNRLGVIPVNKDCVRLPYHGVPVYNQENNLFTIEYLIDIKRQGAEFIKVFLENDKENKPFYYIKKA